MFITLHKENGDAFLVNFDRVDMIDGHGVAGSRLVFNENHAFVVLETPDEIAELLQARFP